MTIRLTKTTIVQTSTSISNQSKTPGISGTHKFRESAPNKIHIFGKPPPRVGVSENVWFFKFKHVDRANVRRNQQIYIRGDDTCGPVDQCAQLLCFVEKIHARNIKCIPFFTPLPSLLFLVVSCFCAACLREEFGGWGSFCLIAYLRVFSVWCMLA